MYAKIKQSTTSYIAPIVLQDSSSTAGAGKTGIIYSNITAYYVRDSDSSVTSISMSSMTAGTFTSGGFIEVDSTHMPGVYEFGVPNIVLSSGKWSVICLTATGIVPIYLKFELDAVNYQDSSAFGLTNLSTSTATLATAANLSTAQSTLNTVNTSVSTANSTLNTVNTKTTGLATAAALSSAQATLNSISNSSSIGGGGGNSGGGGTHVVVP